MPVTQCDVEEQYKIHVLESWDFHCSKSLLEFWCVTLCFIALQCSMLSPWSVVLAVLSGTEIPAGKTAYCTTQKMDFAIAEDLYCMR